MGRLSDLVDGVSIDPTAVLDIALTALLFYGLFSLIQGTRAVRLVIGAIRANRPITNVQVNVSATSVSHTTTVVTRYGPTGGTRNTSSNYSTNPGK